MTERERIARRLRQVPDLDAEKRLAYDEMIVIAGLILDMAEGERRDLGVWEKANLRQAIGSLGIGWLHLAWTDLDLAIAPPERVSPNPVSPEHAQELSKIDVRLLRLALADLAAHPPRRLA